MRAERGSLRTLFGTAIQMLADFDDEYALLDALLPGPTDFLMLDPWLEELRGLGVEIRYEQTLKAIEWSATGTGRPGAVSRVAFDGAVDEVLAGPNDYFVLAVPYEAARPLLVAQQSLPDVFAGVHEIVQRPDNLGDGAEPMVGIQFFLRRDVAVTRGHCVYPKAEWAMTSISQAQFWRSTFTEPLATVFDAPELVGVLSVIVSAWDVTASRIGKAPKDCTEEELAWEAFEQIRDGLGGTALTQADVIGFHVDSDIDFAGGSAHCTTPLWVSPRGSYLQRPLADSGCANLFIASDWARTETDVGSMESADEAARWTVRAIAARAEEPPSDAVLPDVRPLRLWRTVEVARRADDWLYRRGLPHLLDLQPAVRRRIAWVLRGLRAGDDALRLLDDWALIQLASGSRPETTSPESWMSIFAEGMSNAEMDEVLRVFDAVDASEWKPSSADEEGLRLNGLICRVSMLR